MVHRMIVVHVPNDARNYRVVISGRGLPTIERGYDTRDDAWRYVEQYTVNAHNVAFTLVVDGTTSYRLTDDNGHTFSAQES